MNHHVKKLKDLAIAYRLACEFDYCPNPEDYKRICKSFGEKFDINILREYQGLRFDEVANRLIQYIEKELERE